MNDHTVTHGGNMDELGRMAGCGKNEITDFSANINPLGFPEWLRPLISSKISELAHYPDPGYSSLKETVAGACGLSVGEIVFGNGVSELLYLLPGVTGRSHALLPVPSYAEYAKALQLNGFTVDYIYLDENRNFQPDIKDLEEHLQKNSKVLVLLGHPNNPTGNLLDRESILQLAEKYPEAIFIIDESFIDFCDPVHSFKNGRPENIIILWSLTKILAVPGLRLGICMASPKYTALLAPKIPPWSLNSLAAAVMAKAVADEEYFTDSRNRVAEWRADFTSRLEQTGIFKVFPGSANFILLKITDSRLDAGTLREKLVREYKIGIRDASSFAGLGPEYIRVAVRSPEENSLLIAALNGIYHPDKLAAKKRKTPALMLQGTGSNVGKSILTAALCRILYQDGYKVAPFKSQNMALNSFVTANGEEIGRAQALQAQACKILPDVRMNPVLLKPSNDKSSQVIINGKPVAAMDFRDYAKMKPQAFLEAQKAYDSLAAEYDVVVLEGAGSASEVNLKKNDLVNMRMARYADAKVFIVGNIDYGGIFGGMMGTMETLAEWERSLVAGFIINRFRGIKDLLRAGIDYLETYSGKPVIGVVPYVKGLSLPEEDSLEFKSGALNDSSPLGERIDVALIDMPRISNHTDVDALRLEPDVRVRIVRNVGELGSPDVVILAGSKNVMGDLQYIEESGIGTALRQLASGTTEIIGICGGYQMLGNQIEDPFGIESPLKVTNGLGLLPVTTVFEKEKYLKQHSAVHIPSGRTVRGYEIHHGRTVRLNDAGSFITREDGVEIGCSVGGNHIWGTYLHGIFDEDGFRRWFIDTVRGRKGLAPLGNGQIQYNLETELDRLALLVRESLDMDAIYKIAGLK